MARIGAPRLLAALAATATLIALAQAPANAHAPANTQAPANTMAPIRAAADYASLVLADQPSVYYRLGETQGATAADSSGHGVTGTYSGSAVTGVDGAVPSDTDNAVLAPDRAPVLRAPAAALPSGSAARTVEFWFKPGTASGLTPVLTYGGTTISLRDIEEVHVNDNSAQDRTFALPYNIADNAWHLWTITYDGAGVTFYLDGQSLGTQSMPMATSAGGDLQLGGWAGSYDELAVYPTALSDERVSAHWTRGQSATTACAADPTDAYGMAVRADSPTAFYPLGDRPAGRSAFDASGNCRNAGYSSSSYGAKAGGAVEIADRGTVLTASAGSFPSAAKARTVEFWFKAAGASGLTPVLRYGGTTISLRDIEEVHVTDNSAQDRVFALPYNIADDAWHMWNVVYDGRNVTFYLDGQQLGTQIMPLATRPGGGLWLGGWAGDYSKLAVYPAALTAARVGAHWTAGASTRSACATAPADGYAATVVADKPAAYFRLGDVAGGRVAYDYSGNCRNAATASFAGGTAGALAGDTDGAAEVATRGNLLTASTAGLPTGAGERTVEFWFKAAGASGLTPVLRYGGTTISLRDVEEVHVTDNSAQDRVFALPYNIADGAWHLWDVAYDGTEITFSLDGQSLGTRTMPLATQAGGGLWLGGWAGAYDELAVYPAALSADRVGAHWTAGNSTGPACAGAAASAYGQTVVADKPALYYRLDDAGSRVAFETGGKCRNAAYGTYVTKKTAGAVNGDSGSAAHVPDRRPVLRAPAASLPTGASARTIEFWFKADGASGLTPVLTYGGTTISLRDVEEARITDNAAQERTFPVPFNTADNLWHLWNVTYDGSKVTFYLDGESLGTQAMPVDTREGGSLQLGGWAGDYDELAVYPAALTAERIAAHYRSGLVGSNAAVSGTVTFDGRPVAGALVQGCTAAGACVQGRTNRNGLYVLSVAPGSYDITVFPPSTGNGSAARLGSAHAEAPATTSRITADVDLVVAALPSGSSIESPTVGTQTSGVPTIFWAEPTVYRTTGCPNGLGVLSVVPPDGNERSFTMTEKPLGSGKYAVTIPPLSPMHGDAQVTTSILCRISATPFVPGGGPEAGGNKIIVHVDSSSPAASFAFGGVTAPAFTKDAEGVYLVTAPPGTGAVPVSMRFADGTSRTLDTYHYIAATKINESGPANAGNQITITGNGFTPNTVVMFDERPAENVTVESPTRLRVTVPSGTGTVPVTVVSGGGAVSGGSYSYQGAITKDSGSAFECPDVVCSKGKLALGIAYNFESARNLGKHFATSQTLKWGAQASVETLASEYIPYILGLSETQRGAVGLVGDAGFLLALAFPEVAPAVLLATTVIALGMWAYNHNEAFRNFVDDFWHMLIDPSGTIVDRNGRPVPGATVTLLRQGDDGKYAPVPAASEMIDPHVNPQMTPESGAFAWMAAAGSYRVRATSADCVDPATGSGAVVEDGPHVLPPPAIGLVLTLPCTLPTPVTAPAITGASPSGGLTAGDTVTIFGTDLFGATAVTFGDRAATSFKVLSPYAVSAVAPAGTGTVPLRVTTPGGTASADVTYLPVVTTAKAATTTTVTAGSVTAGSPVTVKVEVKAVSGTPAGTVTVSEGAVVLGTAALTTGAATLTLSGVAAGSHTITAAYAGNDGFLASSGTATFTVKPSPGGGSTPPAATSAVLTVAPSTSVKGDPVKLSARITSPAGVPSGTVRFRDGSLDLGGAALTGGVATLTTAALTVGRHNLTVVYAGTTSYAASTGSAVHTVKAPALTIASTASRPSAGRLVTLRATAPALPSAARQIRIVETNGRTTRVVATCTSVTACAATLRHDPGAFRYQAQALDGSRRVLVSSAAVVVTWTKPAMGLRPSATKPARGAKVTLRATTAASTSGTPYRFVIRDVTTKRIVRVCGTATTCTVAVANGKSTHRYEAQTITAAGAVIARSATVTVTWR
ncbi:LamG-like jellyroll fold domain-containing protein [Actinoplanes sp. CA-131856]